MYRFLSTAPDAEWHHWVVPEDYQYDAPTCVAHRHPRCLVPHGRETSNVGPYDPKLHGEVCGEFADIRRTLDYSWHTNYTPDRQEWQDKMVRGVVRRSPPAEQPWVIFTCGAMGAGKGHVMSWLTRHRDFPLRDLVCIDPDRFKCAMPEWGGYVRHAVKEAGTMCHKESGLLQELAQEAAMRAGRHLWIDGSLADHRWYTSVFQQMRARFPRYRIAILHVHCRPGTVYERAEKRGRQTGRFVPNALLQQSIEQTRESIGVLGPLADFVAQVDNESDRPWLWIEPDASKAAGQPEMARAPAAVAPQQGGGCAELARANLLLSCFGASSMLQCPTSMNCSALQGPLTDFVAAVNRQLDTPWIRVCCSRSGFSVSERLVGG